MLTLATRSLPAQLCATSSRIGAIILHGPHHSAQKSTSTGSLDFSTCSSNWSSPTWAIAVLTCILQGVLAAAAGAAAALRLHCVLQTGLLYSPFQPKRRT